MYGGTSGTASVVYRCAIRRVTDGLMPDTRTGLIEPVHMWGNYIETRWLSYDRKQTDGTHNDGIQLAGGDGYTIVGNSLHNPTGNVVDPASGLTVRGQCIAFTPYHEQRISGTKVYKNWLYGSFTQISLWESWGGRGLTLGGPAVSGAELVGNRHGGQCAWPVLMTPAQDAVKSRYGGNIAAAGGLVWNNGTIAAGGTVNVKVAANTSGTGL